jgi:hypothetical protein
MKQKIKNRITNGKRKAQNQLETDQKNDKIKPQKNLVRGMFMGRPVWEIWVLVGP